jgi:hypothetical protein
MVLVACVARHPAVGVLGVGPASGTLPRSLRYRLETNATNDNRIQERASVLM